jgi:hypothetical protein
VSYLLQYSDHKLTITDSIALNKWHIIGRRATTVADFLLAKRWLNDCIAKHTTCPKPLVSRLPSRILDLDISDGTSDLRLLINTISCDRYATLSHCWGGLVPRLTLTVDTYDEFQIKIKFDHLPRTFQDAVTATRSLGLRYLWIDSLCIIQGSESDWEQQCTEMKRIYRDSFVTLAGAAALDCNSGFLHDRPASYDVAIQLFTGTIPFQLVLSHYGIVEDETFPSPEPNSPLSTRAWILQERLLSGRVLSFGTKMMYLECFTNVRFDNCHCPVLWSYTDTDMVVKTDIDQLKSSTLCFEYWNTIVQTYSRLSLTKITDRLPALSGLASDFQSATDAQYLAGIWREDMPRALSWHVPYGKEGVAVSSPTSPRYIAPSWSWAAANFGVTFPCNRYDIAFHSDLDIIATGVVRTGLDPFGGVESGFIDAYARIQRGLVKELPDWISRERRFQFIISSNTDNSILALYVPDDTRKVENRELTVWLLQLGRFSLGVVVALAVKPVDGEYNTYKRMGLAMSNNLLYGSNQEFVKLFQDVGKTKIRLI